MTTFIVVDMNNLQIDTLIFITLSSITGASSVRFYFSRKFLKTFSRNKWSEICILRKCNFDLPNWISSPRSRFLTQTEFEDSSLRPSFLMMKDWVSSGCLSWEYIVRFWLMFRVSFLSRDETLTTLIQFLIPRTFESYGISFFVLRWFTDIKFIGLGFVTVDVSLEVLSWALLDMTLCFLFERKWLEENIEKEQTKKMVPLITFEVSFNYYVCELVFEINIFYLDLCICNDSVE